MSETPAPEESEDSDLAKWITTVRDPAAKATEGRRVLRAGKDAEASYEIASLPDARFAVKVRYAYHSGNCSTASSPWCAFGTRSECLAYFLDGARQHFTDVRHIASEAQLKAQKRMAALLNAILVFVEPPVEKPDPKELEQRQAAEARMQAQRAETTRKLKEQFPLFADLFEKDEN